MTEPSRTTGTTQAAKTTGAQGKTTQTNQLVVSGPYMEILIGGPYTKDKEEHLFGHAALRVVVGSKEVIYDFGRYGKTWGKFDSEGEGVMNVWTSFRTYIAGENSLKRTTTGFVYYLDKAKAEAVIAHFDGVVAKQKEVRRKTPTATRYVLPGDYHPTTNNCTTVTLEGAKVSGKKLVQDPAKYREMRGLSWLEKQAARTQTWTADGIFMPADLQAMLEGNTEARYDKKNIYK
ncbi:MULTISPECIES: hypothetical protein [Pseudomonas]|uniref:Uncharacterized protein n=1 Tax=Pseudomonas chlororaphis TaxID=587753 RepID=A0A0D5Y221_9PSED|nr:MULTISPECIES: hypothetical protein [Pseudomonas]AJO78123.1 hypothetical protein TO66_12735 [Pseudomonas sp. MRSN 12121]AKA25042.1 hypothetical protein PCL1606_35910 [Pseudomonas chlororaphis]MCB2254071.1 hypothetical protein [Pseudomonas chlororaphis]